MLRRLITLALASLPVLTFAQAPPAPRLPVTAPPSQRREASTTTLPIRRVVLYKTGVGYFEHLGRVRALQQEQHAIGQDQQRLRENMKALRGSEEEKTLLQRYARQLDAQETRLDAL